MGKSNRLGIAISAVSILIIGGSVYYNSNISKSTGKPQQTTVTTTTIATTEQKIVLNKENVKISTEISDEQILFITLENVSDRGLTDIVVEASYREGKIAEILIPTLNKGDKKKIEVSLDNKLDSQSIKEIPEMTAGFRLIESVEFTSANGKGEVLVSSIRAQEKSYYIEKIKSSTLEQTLKDKLIKEIEAATNLEEIEKLLKENNIIDEVKLSSEHVAFKDGQSELKVEDAEVNENTTSVVVSTNSVTTVNSQPTAQTTTSPIYGYIPAPSASRVTTQAAPSTTAIRPAATSPVTTVKSITG